MNEAAPVYDADVVADERVVERALRHHALSAARTHRLINLSENATYLVEDPDTATTAVLRVHRPDYHTAQAIESELDWLTDLGAHTGISTPAIVPTTDGARVVTVDVDGEPRHAVLFAFVDGAAPDETALRPDDFATLGEITAVMHRHARTWRRPAGFTRFTWDFHHALGAAARWGRWQDGIGVGRPEEDVLGPAADLVRERLADYGTGPGRYGLIHADLRLANLLVDRDRVNVIDFDDCGLSWFLFDFGAAVSFLEHDPRLAEWQDAWLRGYRREEPVAAEDEAMLPTFVMMRRLQLVAWMGSHSHSRECQEIGPGYTGDSCALAERYLRSGGRALLADPDTRRTMFSSMADRSVVVTGGSRGIGRGIARVFARAGARVLITGRSEGALADAVDDLKSEGEVSWFAADVADRAQCDAMAAAAVERHGGIDVLCANAGIFPSAKLVDLTGDDLEQVLGTNLKGTIFAVQACMGALAASGRGRVVVTSSITGPTTGYPGWSHYGASKAAQLGFIRTAAMELAAAKITINAVLPGNVLTEGLEDLGQDYLDGMAASIPLGRLGSTEDIGNAALFLASAEAGYITGQTLVVDGGQVLPESLEALQEA